MERDPADLTGPVIEDALIGQVVANRYRVQEKLGEGGMGTVYAAEHVAIGKRIALKVLLQEYARKADLKERFLQEAKAAAMIGHENIVDITDFGHTPTGSVFFAMEFLDGEDLSRAIRAGAMSWERAKPILMQICRAMGAAHAKGIIHRDMKPENIYLIEREGRPDFVKVLDFGIAKVSNLGDGERRLTRTGMIFGTPEYMSPEQAQGHKPDHRVDIYALGVIMYEMLTGTVPFKADTFMGILTKHIFEAPTPPRELRADIPNEVEDIVLKAMSKDRDDRFRTMTEMATTAAQASGRMTRPTGNHPSEVRKMTPAPSRISLGDGPVSVPEIDHSVPRNSSARIFVVASVVALLLVGVLVYTFVLRKSKDPDPKGPGGGVVAAADATPARPDAGPRSTPDQRVAAASPDAGPKKPGTVRLKVFSRPPGATILAGQRELGRTNTTIRLERSEKKTLLRLQRKGYEELTVEILPDRDDTIQVKLKRKRRVRAGGNKPPAGTKDPPPRDPPPKRPPPKRDTQDLLNPFGKKR